MPEYKYISAVIAAGGSGDRFGGDIPKQFMELENEPVIIRSIMPFLEMEYLRAIAVSVPADWLNWMRDQVKQRNWNKIVKVVQGGAHRGESVYAGLKAVKDSDIVHIHDAARPFLTSRMLTDAAQKAWEYGGAAVAVPVKDTLKKESEGIISSTVNRENLWQVQTPQTFRTKVIIKAYKIAMNLGFRGTDDCVLLERLTGIKVKLVQGSDLNIKITRPEDFQLASAIVKLNSYNVDFSSTGNSDADELTEDEKADKYFSSKAE